MIRFTYFESFRSSCMQMLIGIFFIKLDLRATLTACFRPVREGEYLCSTVGAVRGFESLINSLPSLKDTNKSFYRKMSSRFRPPTHDFLLTITSKPCESFSFQRLPVLYDRLSLRPETTTYCFRREIC